MFSTILFRMTPLRRRAGLLAALAISTTLAACTPALDWRDFRAPDRSYTALMPAKPTTVDRRVTINGMPLSMSMSAVEVRDVMFAIGVTSVPDASLAPAAQVAMKDALLKNIETTFKSEKTTQSLTQGTTTIELEAIGAPNEQSKGLPRAFFAHIVVKGKVLYQAVVVGPQNRITNDAVDTFMTSFKAL